MHVHAGEVRGQVPDAAIDLRGGGGSALGPGGVIPAMAEQDAALLGHAGGRLADHAQARREAVCRRQVQPGQRQPGRRQVHMRVDERGRDPRTAQVDHLMSVSGVQLRARVIADPCDPVTCHEHGAGEGIFRRVDVTAREQQAGVGTAGHAPARSARPITMRWI